MNRRRKLPTYLDDSEGDRLLAAARKPRDRCLFALMLLAGLRVAEACALRVERLDFGRRELLVYEGKGSRDRLLPLAPRLEAALRDWLGERRTGYVFPGRKPESHLGTGAARYLVKTAVRRADIHRPDPRQRISCHALRHSFASALVAKGADLATVRDLLGHSNLATTSIYAHCSADRLRRAIELLENRSAA